MSPLVSFGDGVYAVDAHYLRPHFASIHIVEDHGHVALIDSGTNHAVPSVESALRELGLAPSQVDYLLLTHVHLDHAGGAGALMRVLPNAQLVVHPRGARHMIDPSRLVAGATAIYGPERMQQLYGDLVPVDAARVLEAKHDLILPLGDRCLHILDTPGHARHHVCIRDTHTSHIFTGDAFGIAYPELAAGDRPFLFPGTTPVQFDPVAMHSSIDMLMGFKPAAVYLTHFGKIHAPAGLAPTLHRLLDAHVAIAQRWRDAGSDRCTRLSSDLTELLVGAVLENGCGLRQERIQELLAHDVDINAQGLEVWLQGSST